MLFRYEKQLFEKHMQKYYARRLNIKWEKSKIKKIWHIVWTIIGVYFKATEKLYESFGDILVDDLLLARSNTSLVYANWPLVFKKEDSSLGALRRFLFFSLIWICKNVK